MTKIPYETKLVIENLAIKDKKFSSIVKQIGFINLKKRDLNFDSLLKIIINQQLSNKVADVIFLRLKNETSVSGNIDPKTIIDLDPKVLRKLGISFSKISFMKEIAKNITKSPNLLKSWENLDDENALYEITKLKGFGPWSANIILLFYLGRNDIFPFNDSTLQKAYFNIYKKKLSKSLKEINWARPYRSIVALYFWRWVDKGMIKIED
ncbi:hypothetical protein N9S02_01300 [Alphaproteobacteria bacterium]|nr:hypothetical protein [Alphaproteobacteria bacterium]